MQANPLSALLEEKKELYAQLELLKKENIHYQGTVGCICNGLWSNATRRPAQSADLQRRLDEAENKLRGVGGSQQDLSNELQRATARCNEYRQKMEFAQSAAASAEQQAASSRAQQEELHRKLVELTETLRKLETENVQLQSHRRMEAMSSPSSPGLSANQIESKALLERTLMDRTQALQRAEGELEMLRAQTEQMTLVHSRRAAAADAELVDLRAQLATAHGAAEGAQASALQHEAELKKALAALADAETAVSAAAGSAHLTEAEAEIARLRAEVARRDGLETRVAELSAQSERLFGENRALHAQLQELQGRFVELSERLMESADQLQSEQARRSRAAAELAAAKEELDAARVQNALKEAGGDTVQRLEQLAEQGAQMELLTKRNQALEQELSLAKAVLHTHEKHVERVKELEQQNQLLTAQLAAPAHPAEPADDARVGQLTRRIQELEEQVAREAQNVTEQVPVVAVEGSAQGADASLQTAFSQLQARFIAVQEERARLAEQLEQSSFTISKYASTFHKLEANIVVD